MPIANDTRPLSLDAGYLHGAHLALVNRDHPAIPRQAPARLDTTTPGYRLAASTANLRAAVNLAIACLRTGRVQEALDTLEAV